MPVRGFVALLHVALGVMEWKSTVFPIDFFSRRIGSGGTNFPEHNNAFNAAKSEHQESSDLKLLLECFHRAIKIYYRGVF
jgi:hypothetical protein